MSFELNVLVVGQDKPCYLPFSSAILLHNEVDEDSTARYCDDSWPFFCCQRGILYSLVQDLDGDGFYSALNLCDGDFEHPKRDRDLPDFLSKDDRKQLTPLLIEQEFYEDFKKILRFLLDNSPVGFIMFQSRYQCRDSEIIFGTMPISTFFEQLEKKNIMFNACYIIGLDGRKPIDQIEVNGEIFRKWVGD